MTSPTSVLIIPARLGSKRFPSKPLALINGRPLLYRTWLIGKSVRNIDDVYIATDDATIKEKAEEFGAKVLLTSPECTNGSERVFEAIQQLHPKPAIAINLQGDAVLTPPWVIQSVVDMIQKDPGIQIVTPAVALDSAQLDAFVRSKSSGRTSGTTVAFNRSLDALYFSKAIIPQIRDQSSKHIVYRHIGLYAYRYESLKRYASLEPTPLEEAEKLEQLRALENDIPIRIVLVDYKGRTHWSIDNPEDVAIAEEIIQREGELL